MRAASIAMALLGIAVASLGWRHRHDQPSAAYISGAVGMFCICSGMYMLLSTPTLLQAYTYPFLVLTIVAGVVAMLGAFWLWGRHNAGLSAASTNRANLAIALGGGAAVALLTAWLQLFVTFVAEDQQKRDKVTSAAQQELSLREDFRFRIAITRDLTGFSPPRDPGDASQILDLSGLGLRGKELAGSNLETVRLHGSDLVEANLSGSRMRGAKLGQLPDGPRTDLRAATLRGADLRGASLSGANLTEADLRGAFVHGADFTAVRMEWADLRGVFCAEDTNERRVCTEDELIGMGLPPAAQRPASACWPPMDPVDEDRICGKQARRVHARNHP
jgi:uncharacterized protein YjbI with pentapeptide repeats